MSECSARNDVTRDRRQWPDNYWEPLDDYQYPYIEPILPPPYFIPNGIRIGVPLPLKDEGGNGEFINLYSKNHKNERTLEDNKIKIFPPSTKMKIDDK